MQNGENDILSFMLGTLGVCFLTYLLKNLGVAYPDFTAAIACCLMYSYIR